MKSILFLFYILIINIAYGASKKLTLYAVDIDGELKIRTGLEKGQEWVAVGDYLDNTNQTGWAYLTIKTNERFPDAYQSYAAGFVEGHMSPDLIYNSWRNTQDGFCKYYGKKFCDKLVSYLNVNFEWMSEQIRSNKETSPYWHQVDIILGQLIGLHDGYNKISKKYISQLDLLLMNFSGDIEDVSQALDPKKRDPMRRFINGRCSALIKVVGKSEDLLVSQVTWNSYQSMLRILKKYEFNFHLLESSKVKIPGHTALFSSYPTYLSSGDDFTILSSNLLSQETTIGNSNPDLWKYVNPDGQVQEWIRAIVANRLATSGKEWADIFKKYNSGTYNNQWMIVDYNKFKPGKPIQNDTLWIIEQIPSLVVAEDQSHILSSKTYWASYNTPFYPKVFNLSGLPALVEKYGDWFSYDKTPRALIFDRDHHKVKDVDSLLKLMRYNDFKKDPLSKCDCTPPYSAENAISARNDLNPKSGSYPFAALGHRSHGGTDAKVTSNKLFRRQTFRAVAGPTWDQQPPFKWSDQDFAADTPHFGQPDELKFDPIDFNGVF